MNAQARSRRRKLLATLLLGGLAALAWGQDSPAEAPGPAPAQLYVLNISGPTLFASNQDITDNGAALVSLPRMRYQRLDIAAGAHEFRFKDFPSGKRVARLDAAPGQTYYLLVGYNPAKSWVLPLAGDPLLIRLASEDEARLLLPEMKPLP